MKSDVDTAVLHACLEIFYYTMNIPMHTYNEKSIAQTG